MRGTLVDGGWSATSVLCPGRRDGVWEIENGPDGGAWSGKRDVRATPTFARFEPPNGNDSSRVTHHDLTNAHWWHLGGTSPAPIPPPIGVPVLTSPLRFHSLPSPIALQLYITTGLINSEWDVLPKLSP